MNEPLNPQVEPVLYINTESNPIMGQNKMKQEMFVGTKLIFGSPMTRQEYNNYRGWELPADEKHLADEDGMLVEYEDTTHPNVEGHAGYVSWSPMNVFVDAYKANGNFSFGAALELLERGFKVARKGWNGKGMWLIMVPGTDIETMEGTPYNDAGLDEVTINPHIDMFTATGEMQPGWLASQTDMLAKDWGVVS